MLVQTRPSFVTVVQVFDLHKTRMFTMRLAGNDHGAVHAFGLQTAKDSITAKFSMCGC